MPAVPVLDENQIAPTPVTGAKVEAADYGAAGEQVGAAVARFGQAGTQAVDAEDRINQVYDEAGAKRLTTQSGTAMRDLLHGDGGFLYKQGIDALNAKPDVVKTMNDARDQAIAQATNPRMKRMVTDSVGALYANNMDAIQTHAQTQGIQWNIAESQGLQQLRVQDAVANADDPALLAANIGAAQHEIDAQAALQGTPPAVVAGLKQKLASDVFVQIADAKAGTGDPQKAQDIIDQAFARGDMLGSDYLKATTSLYHPLLTRAASATAATLIAAQKASDATPAATGAGTVPVAAGTGGTFDAKQFFHDFVAPHEGGYAAHDANGAPVNFGINQSANPGVDVKHMTKGQAADIFASKYAVKAQGMTPALGGVYSDTAYINPARADQFLKASGGDPAKFLQLREAWQANLVATDPAKYGKYAHAWNNRNADLGKYIAGAPGGAAGGSTDNTDDHDQTVDTDSIKKKIDADPTMSFDMKQAVWEQVKTQAGDLETATKAAESDAKDAAYQVMVNAGPGNFKSTDMIPRATWRALGPEQQAHFQQIAASNVSPKTIPADGPAYLALHVMSIEHPDQFQGFDMRGAQGSVTPSEYAQLLTDQAKMRSAPHDNTANIRSQLDSTINIYSRLNGLNITLPKPGDNSANAKIQGQQYLRVMDSMRSYVDRATEHGKRAPTDADMKAAFDSATMQVISRGSSTFGYDEQKPLYKIDPAATQNVGVPVPKDIAARIVTAFGKAQRRVPSPAEIGRIYLQRKGTPGYWQ